MGWVGNWPSSWRTIHIAERKIDMISQMGYFCVLNNSLTEMWKIPSNVIKTHMLGEVSNSREFHGDRFFMVPVALAERVML